MLRLLSLSLSPLEGVFRRRLRGPGIIGIPVSEGVFGRILRPELGVRRAMAMDSGMGALVLHASRGGSFVLIATELHCKLPALPPFRSPTMTRLWVLLG